MLSWSYPKEMGAVIPQEPGSSWVYGVPLFQFKSSKMAEMVTKLTVHVANPTVVRVAWESWLCCYQ